MNFGIFMNKILVIEISSSNFDFMSIFLDILKKIVKKYESVQDRFV
jgi:hypothetical protein